MKIRILPGIILFALTFVSSAAFAAGTSFPFRTDALKTLVSTAQNTPLGDEGCHPVSGIELDFMYDGAGLITWNPVQGVEQYTVEVVDEDGFLLMEAAVNGTQVEVTGLTPGMEYTITICYTCPANEERICAYKKCRYVIIEDVIVMLDSKSCNCSSAPLISGSCSNTGANLYALVSSKVYHIELLDGSTMSFVVHGGKVNPVGSCASNFGGLFQEYHLGPGFTTQYYKVGTSSKIFFHGSQFCVSGAAVGSLTYCNIYWPLDPSKFKSAPGASGPAYPNPFTDVIHIEIPVGKSEGNSAFIQLFDSRGQCVLEENRSDLSAGNNTILINAGNALPGIYWLTISREGVAPITSKLLKIE